jgi:tRNA threonylcarbamoyladenosine biosynthesis protein TsaB
VELIIDTSTKYATLAISNQGEMVTELSWESNRNHSVELLPTLWELLNLRGYSKNVFEAVVVATGPGSFSSVRVGMSTAKSFAAGSDIPIVGIPTILAETIPYSGLGRRVMGLIPAGGRRVYSGILEEGEDRIELYDLIDTEKNPVIVDQETIVCGEAVHKLSSDGILTKDKLVVDLPPPTRRASVMAKYGLAKIQSGNPDDPALLEPVYVRSAQIESAERNRKKI